MSLRPQVAASTIADDAIGWTAVGVAAAGALSVGLQSGLHVGPANCFLRSQMGFPCPVCGMSTVAIKLLRLDVVGALRLDPVGVVLLGVIGTLAAVQVLRSTGRSVRWLRWPWAWAVPLGVLALHWVFTLTGVVTLSPLR